MTLTTAVRQISPGTSILDLQGDISASSEGALMDAHRQASAAGARAILLNFGAVSHMNGAGLGRLVTLRAHTSRQGQRLLAFGLTDHHRQIFALTRLDKALELYPGEAEAVAAASTPDVQRLQARQPLEGRSAPSEGGAAPAGWASPVARLEVTEIPAGVVNLNVQGRQLYGPIRGFGPLWQKTFEVRLTGAATAPRDVIRAWKSNFGRFWPKGNRFYGRPSGIVPGDVALLHLAGPGGLNPPGGLPLISTGLMVIYSDDDSFSFMASEGHTIAGMITFSAYDEGGTVVRIEALFRPGDPFFELMFRLGIGGKMEDSFWRQILRNLARHFGAASEPQLSVVCIDPRLQWAEARNIWHNAAIHTALYILGAPIRWVGGLFRKE